MSRGVGTGSFPVQEQQRGGREGGGSFRENKERKGEHPRLFSHGTTPPPAREKCQQYVRRGCGPTTNSASLTSQGKRSRPSEFLMSFTSSRHLTAALRDGRFVQGGGRREERGGVVCMFSSRGLTLT